jgi:hypothetical protein
MPPEGKDGSGASAKGNDASNVSYQSLNTKRASQLRQVTKIHNEVKTFDENLHSIFVLRNHREYLLNAHRIHQELINNLMDHEDADFEKIEEDIDKFRTAHSNAMTLLEEKLEKAKQGSREDNLAALQAQFDAVVYSFYEFKIFIADESSINLSAHELRFRMNDLQKIQSQYHELWGKIYAISDDPEKECLRSERVKFNADCYKTLGLFDARLQSSNVPPVSRTPRNTAEPKLPKIELPSYNGQPVN